MYLSVDRRSSSMYRLGLSQYEKRLLCMKDQENQGLKVYNNIMDIEQRQRMKELCRRRQEFEQRYSALQEIRHQNNPEDSNNLRKKVRRNYSMDTINEDQVDYFKKKIDATLKRITETPFGSRSELQLAGKSPKLEFDKGLVPTLPDIQICETTLQGDSGDKLKTLKINEDQKDLNVDDSFLSVRCRNNRRCSLHNTACTASSEGRQKVQRKARRHSEMFDCVSSAERKRLKSVHSGYQKLPTSPERPSIMTRGESFSKQTFTYHSERNTSSLNDVTTLTGNSDSGCSDCQSREKSSLKQTSSPNGHVRKASIVKTPRSSEISMLQMLTKTKKGQEKFKYFAKLLRDHVRQDDEVIFIPGVSGTTWEETFSSCRYIRNVYRPGMPTQQE